MIKEVLKYLICSCLCFNSIYAQSEPKGLFIGLGIGPRMAIGDFSTSNGWGIGVNIDASYTSYGYLPFFVYGRIGFEHFPGLQDYYRITDYSSFSVSTFPLNAGVKMYLPTIIENVVIILPTLEAGISYAYFNISKKYAPITGKTSYTEANSKLGYHAGFGLTMFLLEIMAYYNHFEGYQYLSTDVKIRLPIFISF